MNDAIAARVEQLAEILQNVRQSEPDWFQIYSSILQYLEGRDPAPKWERLSKALLRYLSEEDSSMQLIEDVLRPLMAGEAKDCEQIAQDCALAPETVRQVLNALVRGGYQFTELSPRSDGPWKVGYKGRKRQFAYHREGKETGRPPKRRQIPKAT